MEANAKVLVPIDCSEISALVVKRAAQWAKRYSTTEIILLMVMDEVEELKKRPDLPVIDLKKKAAEEINEVLEKAENEFKAHGVACRTRMEIGPVAEEIVRIAEEEKVFAILMGSRGTRGLRRMLLGSTADKVIRYAHCPVGVVRPIREEKEMEANAKVLVPIDGSDITDLVVKRSGQWAKRYDYEVILLGVIGEEE